MNVSFVYSLVFGNCFILVRVVIDPDPKHWMGSITELFHTLDNLSPTGMFIDSKRKTENLKETYTDTGRMCKTINYTINKKAGSKKKPYAMQPVASPYHVLSPI